MGTAICAVGEPLSLKYDVARDNRSVIPALLMMLGNLQFVFDNTRTIHNVRCSNI
jgi:hypothetical protein